MSPTPIKGKPYTGTILLDYYDANGFSYSPGTAINSTGVTGLTASLVAGTLSTCGFICPNDVIFNVTGTPSNNGNATFLMSFLGNTCSFSKAVTNPTVGTLSSSATFSPAIINQGVLYTGTMSVPYTGGSGGVAYSSSEVIHSTGVTGLTATLVSGTLSSSGSLVYNITGTPSGYGNAIFALSFGGKTVNISKAITPSTCNLRLNMFNTGFGSGWNGFQLQFVFNGSPVGTYTLASGSSGYINVPVAGSGTLAINITNLGTSQSTVSYDIVMPDGAKTWFRKSPNHSLGNAYTATCACP